MKSKYLGSVLLGMSLAAFLTISQTSTFAGQFEFIRANKSETGESVALRSTLVVPGTRGLTERSFCYDDLSSMISNKVLWRLDFEDLDENGWILGWSEPKYDDKYDEQSKFELDNTVKHSGNRSLKISAKTTDSYGDIELRTKFVRVQPGEEYTLSYWIKGKDVISTTGHLTVLQVTGEELSNGDIGRQNTVYWSTHFPRQSYGWQKVETTFTIPANENVLGLVILFQEGSGTVWLDDVVVMPTTDFMQLPKTTLEVSTKTSELGAPARHYFSRGEIVDAEAILRNKDSIGGNYSIITTLTFCGEEIQTVQRSAFLLANELVQKKLLSIDSSKLALGDYLLTVEIENEGVIIDSSEHPIGIRLKPEPEFLFSIGIKKLIDYKSTMTVLDRIDSYYMTPLFYAGEPKSVAADELLNRGKPFITREIYHGQFPLRKGAQGEKYANFFGLSDENLWQRAANTIAGAVRRTSHYPAFFPRILTSDDFSKYGGWDWSNRNQKRFKELTEMEAPVPQEFINNEPTYKGINSIEFPKGLVNSNEPWLAWNRFLTRDVHGGYNDALKKAVVVANPEAKIGPTPGGAQVPLFSVGSGQYPPYNFGEKGFNMLSYYMYYKFWRPNIAYIYYSELAKAGNRDMPLYMMPETNIQPDKSYYWNNFFFLLASGVDGLSYFIEYVNKPEFEEAAKIVMGPIAQRFGPMLTKLKPRKKKIGHLVSYTNANYQLSYPILSMCTYTNMLMSHLDIEPVVEEEILAGRKYDAIILNDVDWLRKDVADSLSDKNKYPLVILDSDVEVPIMGTNIKALDFSLRRGDCTGLDPDYADLAHLNEIRTTINSLVPEEIEIDSNTMIYRRFSAGDAEYIWLIDVHQRDELINFWHLSNQNGSADNPDNANAMKDYLESNIYGKTTKAEIKIKNSQDYIVVDVLNGNLINSTFENGWIDFAVKMPRLQGKLIALYPVPPDSVSIRAPNVIAGNQVNVEVKIKSEKGSKINAVFPIFLELLDPNKKEHSYTRYTATGADGKYSLPITIGINAPKGTWTLNVTELSTGLIGTKTFNVR